MKTSKDAGTLGDLLRGWRSTRGKSQLDLALDADLSQRHLSFIESGRSVPGRAKLLDIAEALDLPLRDRNQLLLAAGYAPMFREGAWDEAHMRSITAAVQRVLRQHEPFPAILMDRYWNVLATNEASPRFFGLFIDMDGRTAQRNVLHLMFDPAGMRPYIRDWNKVATSLLRRVRREAIGGVLDPGTQDLLAALLAYPGAPAAWTAQTGDDLPMIPLSFEKDGEVLAYFSMVTTVGTPTAVAAQELRIECMFPADADTERRHHALAASWPHATVH